MSIMLSDEGRALLMLRPPARSAIAKAALVTDESAAAIKLAPEYLVEIPAAEKSIHAARIFHGRPRAPNAQNSF